MECDTTPRFGDSDNNLLFKIALSYSELCPAADSAPRCGDTDNNLLFKIAKALSICGGCGSPVACSDPAAPSGLAAIMGPGSLLDFDGLGAHVTIPDSASLNISTGLTIEAWVYARSVADEGIFEKTIGGLNATSILIFMFAGDIYLRLFKGAASTTISAPFATTNTLTHVAATWDGVTMKLYLDGVLQANTAALASPIDTGAGESFIGQLAGGVWPFNGQLDEIRVWNVARTQVEILAWKDRVLAGTEPGLAAYWRFDENTGLSAFDSTGNGNTGTLTAGPTWEASFIFPVQADVSWTDNATNETSYEIQYRNLTQAGGFVSAPSLPADSTRTVVVISGAVHLDLIEIQVRAVNGSCVSAWASVTV